MTFKQRYTTVAFVDSEYLLLMALHRQNGLNDIIKNALYNILLYNLLLVSSELRLSLHPSPVPDELLFPCILCLACMNSKHLLCMYYYE